MKLKRRIVLAKSTSVRAIRAILILMSLLLLCPTGFALYELIWYLRLDYNEQGRYFDPAVPVVYEQETAIFYALLALVCGGLLMAALILLLITHKRFPAHPS